MAGKLQQVFSRRFIAQDRSATEAKGFAESDHQQLGPYALLPATAAPLFTLNANAMCVVNHQPGACLAGQTVQLCQRGTVAVHAEYPFGDRQRLAAAGFCQQIGQRLRLVMAKASELGR
ncbi:hypothetical protein D3C71_1910340 [compost metagenome]